MCLPKLENHFQQRNDLGGKKKKNALKALQLSVSHVNGALSNPYSKQTLTGVQAIAAMNRQQPFSDTHRRGFISQWRSELIRVELKKEIIWGEKYKFIMMQREEILSLYCLFEIECNISCAALYQLLFTGAAVGLQRAVKEHRTRPKTHLKVPYCVHFKTFIS